MVTAVDSGDSSDTAAATAVSSAAQARSHHPAASWVREAAELTAPPPLKLSISRHPPAGSRQQTAGSTAGDVGPNWLWQLVGGDRGAAGATGGCHAPGHQRPGLRPDSSAKKCAELVGPCVASPSRAGAELAAAASQFICSAWSW